MKKNTNLFYGIYFGRTVIVDNLDTATLLAKQNHYSFKIVTLQGDCINPSGSMTGGSVTQKTVNILGRNREIEELEKQIKQKQKECEVLEEQKKQYEAGIETIMQEASSLEKVVQDVDIEYATQKQKLVSTEENITRLETRLQKQKEEKEQIVKQKQEMLQTKEQSHKEILQIEETVQVLQKQVEEFALLHKDNQKYIDDLNFDITNLKISVSSFDESAISIEEVMLRIEQELQSSMLSIQQKQEQIMQLQQENKKLEQSIVDITHEIKQIESDTKNSCQEIEEKRNERVLQNQFLTQIEKEITDQFTLIEEIKGQLVKIEVRKAKIEQDMEQVINRLWEEYELTPNQVVGYQFPENVTTTTRQVNVLRSQIKELGSINMDAIEEYKQTKQRYDFLCEQRLDLEDSATKLRKMIQDMTNIMKEQFKEQFEIINKNFNEVFIELFGGGKAELVLEDEQNILECGIDIRVQPTGKKLQNMMLLSGGEKAFTAIALLFAILRMNPSPFCVLDEIEAALDDVNVYRFAEYLKKFSRDTQFLVITHRKGTMEAADTVYGITMEENGISKLLSMKMS